MTLIEIVVVVLLVGIFVPATTASLSNQIQKQSLNIDREIATILAEEGVELAFAGGFYHWFPILRPGYGTGTGTPKNNSVFIPTIQGGGSTIDDSHDITMTIRGDGDTTDTDDVFNPFMGDVQLSPSNPITIRPWSKYRRELQLISRGNATGGASGGNVPRVIEGLVKVYYGPDSTNVVQIPFYIGNHKTSTESRGLYWLTKTTQLGANGVTIDGLTINPSSSKPWGIPSEQPTSGGARGAYYDSSYPYGTGYPTL